MGHSSEENSHEMSDSHEHGSHEMGDHDDHDGIWSNCSQRFWGDDKHTGEAKRIALGASLVAIAAIIIIIVLIVVCCRRKRLMRARQAARHQRLAEQNSVTEEFDPDKHPKAKEAYPVVVIGPVHQGDEKAKEAGPTDPRLTLGVWSPPPAYIEKN